MISLPRLLPSILYFFYALFSVYMFLYTSGGWYSAITELILLGPIFLVISLWPLLISFIKSSRERILLNPRKARSLVIIILLLQSLSLLLNYDDCSGAGGSLLFINKVMGSSCDKSPAPSVNDAFRSIIILLRLSYYYFNIRLIGMLSR